MENMEMRMEMFKKGIKVRQVAKEVGIDPATLSRWMADELTGERLERVQNAIQTLTVGGGAHEQ